MEQVKNVFYASPEEVTPKLIRQVVFHTMSQATSSDDNILASEYNILAVSGDEFLNGFCNVRTYGLWKYCGREFRVTLFNPYRDETVKDAVYLLKCIAEDILTVSFRCKGKYKTLRHVVNENNDIAIYDLEDKKRIHRTRIGTVVNDHNDTDIYCVVRDDNNVSKVAQLLQSAAPRFIYRSVYGSEIANKIEQMIYNDEKSVGVYRKGE